MSSAEPRKDTEAALKKCEAAKKITQAAVGARFQIHVLEFVVAHRQFTRKVTEFEDLVSRWRMLGEFTPPLGDNPVGRSVASMFVSTSDRFVATLGDFRGKLGDAQGAMSEVVRTYAAQESRVASEFVKGAIGDADHVAAIYAAEAVALLGMWADVRTEGYSGSWTPANKHDWRAYSSQELHDFATQGNNPETVFASVEQWQSNTDTLHDSSAHFSNDLGRILSTWDGSAADAAHGALVPLVRWGGDDATGSADRLRQNLADAGEAALRLKGMPGPVEEPTMFDMLNAMLAGSPADVADMRNLKQQADAVKAEQVRYMEQYESAMAAVYDALPEFHLAPTPVPGNPEPGETNPGNSGRWYVGTDIPTTPAVNNAPSPAPAHEPGDDGTINNHKRPGIPGQVTSADVVSSAASDMTGARSPGVLPNPTTGDGGGIGRGGQFLAGGLGAGIPGQGRAAGNVSEGKQGEGKHSEGRGSANGPNRGTPAIAERSAATTQRRGVGPTGAPGNRQEREEDIEHERPAYLVERDPHGTFGTDERTAPPVIG